MTRFVCTFALATVALAGCGSDPPRPASGGWTAPPPSDEGPTTLEDEDPPPPMVTATARPEGAPAFEGTAGITEQKRDVPQERLSAVRNGEHDGYDRVVFEFEGGTLPGYHVEYVDKPVRRCGSGTEVAVAGDAWLLVRFKPAVAHKDKGGATVKQQEKKLKMDVARELEQTCDFEGQVDWVIGVGSPNRYRVLELSGPARVVVDVLHAGGKSSKSSGESPKSSSGSSKSSGEINKPSSEPPKSAPTSKSIGGAQPSPD